MLSPQIGLRVRRRSKSSYKTPDVKGNVVSSVYQHYGLVEILLKGSCSVSPREE